MKVLHLTYKMKRGELLSDYLTILIENERAQSVKVEMATTKKEFSKMFSSFNPDIVHIHTCWNWCAFACAKKALHSGCTLIFSSYGELSPLTMKLEEPIRKKIRSFVYQRQIVQKSDAVLTLSKHEKNDVIQLDWNQRTDIVPSCLLTSFVSADAMAADMIRFYTKVIDTRYRKYMDKIEWQCLCALLHTGLQQDPANKILPSDCLLKLRRLTPQQWQRILICADDEFVRDYVNIGIERLQLAVPNINTSGILRYNPNMPKTENMLDCLKIETNNFITKSRYESVKAEEGGTIKQIITMFANAKVLLQQKKFSLLHLAQLYRIIRFEDYDEDQLMIVLRRMHLIKFARRIMYILSTYLYLEDGYIPFASLNDKKVRTIIECIINKNKY